MDQISILGLPVDNISKKEALDKFKGFLNGDDCRIIITPNPEMLSEALKNDALAEAIRKADMRLPDGISLIHVSKALGTPLRERVSGIDFSRSAMDILAERGESVFFFGGKPGIAEKASEKLTEQIPGLKTAGCRSGYYDPSEEEGIVRQIRESGASLLLVAMGSPKQELFICDHRDELGVKAAAGVGGSFDVWSGTLKRAPEAYRKLGLEWLYRLRQEPSRLGRMARIPVFMLKAVINRTGR